MFRFIFVFAAVIFFSSCNYLPKFTEEKQPKLDTIIDFTMVDSPPSFDDCDEIEAQKEKCFRDMMELKVKELLQNFSDTTTTTIDEVIQLKLHIDKQGNTSIENLETSEIIKKEMPNLEAYLEKAITSFPKLSPALKRGIPVETEYKLPIHIKTE